MCSYTDTFSVPTTSTETTPLALAPLNSSYVAQTEFYTTIKEETSEFKESVEKYVKSIITNQDTKVDGEFEKQLHPLSIQMKDISSKQG